MLFASWVFFAGAIVVTLFSFQCSQWAIKRALEDAEKYYLNHREEYQTKSNPWNTATSWLNVISGVAFVFAVITTAAFVSKNLPNPKNEPTTIQTGGTSVASPGGYAPVSQAEHRPTNQSASSNQPTAEKINP